MNCPVCLNPSTVPHTLTGSDFLFRTTLRTFSFTACDRCHCFFIDPPPEGEELAGFYPALYWWRSSSSLLRKLEGVYRRMALRDHVAFIAKAAEVLPMGGSPARLLDVGCGSGTLLGLLKRRGLQVLGFDSSGEASEIARVESDVDVIVGSRLQDAGFASGAFDLVTLFHVVEHVPDPRAVLAEVRRILHPNGRIVLQIPNIESWQARLCGARWYGLDVPRHVINYSNQSIGRLLADSGFRVCRTRHFNLRDNAPALASSLFPSLDPVGRSVRRYGTGRAEPLLLAWIKHIFYLGTVATSYPFAIAESLAGMGATVMVEAEKA